MLQSHSQHQQTPIKVNGRGLMELVLACAFLSLLSFALWSWWIDGGHVAALDGTMPESQQSLLPQIIRHPAIILSAVITEFILLMACSLALVPPAWWLQTYNIFGTPATEMATPLRWLGQKMHIGHNAPETEPIQIGVNAAGEPIYYEQPVMPGMGVNPFSAAPGQQPGVPNQPGVMMPGQMPQGQFIPGQPVPGQLQPGQLQPGQLQPGQLQPGQPVPGQLQPGQPQPGQPVPGQLMAGQIQPIPGQPATVTPIQPGQAGAQPPTAPVAPLSDVLNFEETEEDDPLADLANIKDILSSAFDEDAGLDPDREALGRTLEEVEMTRLRSTARQILATFVQ